MTKTQEQDDRLDKRAKALRENLKRRKKPATKPKTEKEKDEHTARSLDS